MRSVALLVSGLWAGWWVFFGLASGLGERLSPAGVLLHTVLPGGLFVISAVLAWRWELTGGVLLLLEGVAVLIAYPVMASGRFPLSGIVFVLLTAGLPALVAGALFLADWERSTRGRSRPSPLQFSKNGSAHRSGAARPLSRGRR